MCPVHFHGLKVELYVIVCDLHVDAIMGNDALGTKLPHILDIKSGKLSASDGVTLQLHRRGIRRARDVCSCQDIIAFEQTAKWLCIVQ